MQHWKTWTYGVYVCDKIIYATKFEIIYIYKLRLWVEFLVIFLQAMNGIDIHRLNLQPFRNLKSLD
jgi:hypothetical protein